MLYELKHVIEESTEKSQNSISIIVNGKKYMIPNKIPPDKSNTSAFLFMLMIPSAREFLTVFFKGRSMIAIMRKQYKFISKSKNINTAAAINTTINNALVSSCLSER
ncbi:MAG TPA: hypothetical protein VHP30_13590 [Ignavibacteriales bacterium]|nr:hypothetical protein [Ignavibacteriales bacterium]